MRRLVLILILGIFNSALFSQQSFNISGKVINKATGDGLAGATIALKHTSQFTTTDNQGFYKLPNLQTGKFILSITYVGFETIDLPVFIDNKDVVNLDISLNVVYRIGDAIVISASKRPEKITDAPASIQVIGQKELKQYTGSNLIELLSKVQGIETMRFGVDGFIVNARGLGALNHLKAFQMVDGRNTMYAASPGIMLGNNTSVNKEDIDKIEVLIGPQTALYGPNVDNVLINFITKDPRTSPGTIVAMSAGNQSQFSGRFRYAMKVNNKWAYKITGEFTSGKNFEFYDSLMAGGGNFGPRISLAEKIDHNFRHYRGETHVYYSIASKSDIIITAGGSKNDFAMLSGGGHNQVKGMENAFLQARYVSPHFYANAYNVWVNTGFALGTFPYTRDLWNRLQAGDDLNQAESFATRRTNRLIERNQRFNAEVQYNYHFDNAGLFLVTGLSTQLDRPRAFGNTLVDSFERIKINQFGMVMQLEKKLPWDIRIVGAARYDHHTNFNSYFSPKLGIIKKVGEGSVRFTWGKAYEMPTIGMQYASNVGSFFGNLEGVTYWPNGTKEGVDSVTNPLKVEKVSTVELGYKGPVAKRFYIDISVYNGMHHDFFAQGITVLGRALFVGSRHVTHNPSSAGKVLSDGTLDGAQFATTFNFGKVRVYGMDLGFSYAANKYVNISIKYSLVGSDITKGNNDANGNGFVGEDEKSLNSPTNRVIATLDIQNICKQKLTVNLSARYISQYDFYFGAEVSREKNAGSWDSIIVDQKLLNGEFVYARKNVNWGPLGGFTSFDLGVLYKFNRITSLGMNISNLFNTVQREAPGSPLIRRLIMFELKVNVPNSSDK